MSNSTNNTELDSDQGNKSPPPASLDQLLQTRIHSLAKSSGTKKTSFPITWIAGLVTATIAAILLTLTMLLAQTPRNRPGSIPSSFSSVEDLDMLLEEPGFYLWLEQQAQQE